MDDAKAVAESLSRRELRHESGRILRAVSQGQSFSLADSGVPVVRIVPLDAPGPGLTIVRSARREGGWRALGIRRKSAAPVVEVLDDLRGERL